MFEDDSRVSKSSKCSMFWLPDLMNRSASDGPDPGHFLPPICHSPYLVSKEPQESASTQETRRSSSANALCTCRSATLDENAEIQCAFCSTAKNQVGGRLLIRRRPSSEGTSRKTKTFSSQSLIPNVRLFETKHVMIDGKEHTIQIPMTGKFGMALFKRLHNANLLARVNKSLAKELRRCSKVVNFQSNSRDSLFSSETDLSSECSDLYSDEDSIFYS